MAERHRQRVTERTGRRVQHEIIGVAGTGGGDLEQHLPGSGRWFVHLAKLGWLSGAMNWMAFMAWVPLKYDVNLTFWFYSRRCADAAAWDQLGHIGDVSPVPRPRAGSGQDHQLPRRPRHRHVPVDCAGHPVAERAGRHQHHQIELQPLAVPAVSERTRGRRSVTDSPITQAVPSVFTQPPVDHRFEVVDPGTGDGIALDLIDRGRWRRVSPRGSPERPRP